MKPNEITSFARDCYQRGMLSGFLEQHILVDEEPFALSPVEAAVTEYALNQVDGGHDTLVMSAYPTQSLPVALAVALTYQHHPRRGCDGAPTVLFPRDGYTTVFDDIHYRDTCDPGGSKDSEPVPRLPVAAASNIPDEWRLYTAKRQFRYDGTPQSTPAAIIADLRAPRWGDTYAPQIERYVDAVDAPTIFIADEEPTGLGAEMARERVATECTIRPDHLENSPIDEIPISRRTPLSAVEELLATEDVSYYYYAVGDEELAKLYPRFVAQKIQLQERDIAPAAVGGLFNRLVKLPITPDHWDAVASTHGYYDSIPQQIERLETVGEHRQEAQSRISNYIQTAREIRSHLNDRHVLENYLLNVVERAADEETPVRLVFRNDREREAFLLAAEANGQIINGDGRAELCTQGGVEPTSGPKTVFAGAPPRDSHHYAFPPSQDVVFMYFAVLDDYVTQRGEECAAGSVTHTQHTIGTANVDTSPLDMDDIEADIDDAIDTINDDRPSAAAATESLLGDSSLWGQSDDVGTSSDVDDSTQPASEQGSDGPSPGDEGVEPGTPEDENEPQEQHVRLIEFKKDHDPIEMTPLSQVTIFHPERGEIERTRANSLEAGQMIILIDDIADDIYDLVLQTARERERVREDERLVEGWRDQLNSLFENGWTVQGVQEQIQEMGSDIEAPATISLWRYGRTIAPDDINDIKRIYQLARPGIDATMFEALAREVDAAADRLRNRHQMIGRNIRSLIEYELDASTTELPDHYDHETRRRIREETTRLTISRVTDDTIICEA